MNATRWVRLFAMGIVLVGAAASLNTADAQSWKKRFDEIYQLKPNETVKRIAPPFISERLEYYFDINPGFRKNWPAGPDMMSFWWSESLERAAISYSVHHALSLHQILATAFRLNNYVISGEAEALNLRLSGDWIVRKDASLADRMAALEAILQNELKLSVSIAIKPAEFNVMVAKGRYEMKPSLYHHADESGILFVYTDLSRFPLYRDDVNQTTFRELLESIERKSDLILIDETEQKSQPIQWRWAQQKLTGPDVISRLYLKHITEQTGVEFIPEKRNLPVVVITRSKGETERLE
ncbi:MAG: hypothetical protein GC154_17300 [bacterium]|nr:hypothetical protein [bacterium]